MGENGLPKDWVVVPALDAELKRYTLLAYLQRVNARFSERKLYPYLEDVRIHMEELIRLRRSKKELASYIPGQLLGFDPRSGDPIYERTDDDELLSLIDDVIDFSIPGLRKVLLHGEEMRAELADRINFAPVGIQPIHASEGWLLLRTGKDARVYSYAMSILREATEAHQYRSVHTRYMTTFSVGITCTYEHIKAELRTLHKDQPNPATFVFETEIPLPHIETFMPLAKQLVYEFVSTNKS